MPMQPNQLITTNNSFNISNNSIQNSSLPMLEAIGSFKGWNKINDEIRVAFQSDRIADSELNSAALNFQNYPSNYTRNVYTEKLIAVREIAKSDYKALMKQYETHSKAAAKEQSPSTWWETVTSFFRWSTTKKQQADDALKNAKKQQELIREINNYVAELNDISFEHTDTEITAEQNQDFIATQRRLLSNPTVASIPNQIINLNTPYEYSLNDIFTGTNFIFLQATLPSWLTLSYEAVNTFSVPGNSTTEDISIINNIAYLSYGNSGLYSLDITNPLNITVLDHYNITARGQFITANTLYLATGNNGLEIINISDPHHLSHIGSFDTPGIAQQVVVGGNVAYIADYYTLQVINITNPSKPSLITTYSVSTYVNDVALSSQTLFIADLNYGLRMISVSNPAALTQIGSYSIPFGATLGVTIYNNVAYIANEFNGIQLFNISIASNIIALGSYDTQGAAISITIQYPYALVADYTAGFHLFNISNPSLPALIGSYQTQSSAIAVGLFNNYVLVADSSIGMEVVDLTQAYIAGIPTSNNAGLTFDIDVSADTLTSTLISTSFEITVNQFPELINTNIADQSIFPNETRTLFFNSNLFTHLHQNSLRLSMSLENIQVMPSWVNYSLLSSYISNFPMPQLPYDYAVSVAIQDNIAIIAQYNYPLQILDVSVPNNPSILSTFTLTAPNCWGLTTADNILIAANGASGVSFINVTDTTSPKLISTYNTPGSAVRVKVENNYVYVADSTSLQIINILNINIPVLSGSYNIAAYDVAVQNNLAFLALQSSGVQIVNISNPASPTLVGSYNSDFAFYIAVANNYAYIAAVSHGFYILDVSNPSSPVRIGSTVSAYIRGIVVNSGMAFLADPYYGLHILDVSNPFNVRQIASNTFPGTAYDVAVQGQTVIVASGGGGINFFDISQWQITMAPTPSDVGNYQATLTVTDTLASTGTSNFQIRVEGPPQLLKPIPSQYAEVGQAFNYFIPQKTFFDPNFDVISYIAELPNQQSLPSWLQFNPVSAIFAGTPTQAPATNYTVIISATDNIAGSVNATFYLYVDHAPYVNERIPDQIAGLGVFYEFTVSNIYFYDQDDDVLSYSAQNINGQSLPNWLSFNPSNRTFYGTANTTTGQVYNLQVTARDPYIGAASTQFQLRTLHYPQLTQTLPSVRAGVNNPFELMIPSTAFIDVDQLALTYQAFSNGGSLPNWLSFQNLRFSGQPASVDYGVLNIDLVASDPYGASAHGVFNITVTNFPQLINTIVPPGSVVAGQAFQFQIAQNTFQDSDSPVLFYSAELQDGSPLPSFMQFNNSQRLFSGFPTTSNTGKFAIVVQAADAFGSAAQAPFNLLVVANFPPQVVESIPAQTATVTILYDYFINPLTFSDPNGNNLTYTASGLPAWLKFNNQTLNLIGTPGRGDTGYISDLLLQIAITANDGHSQVTTSFTMTVTGTSNFSLAFKVGGILVSALSFLAALVKNRAKLTNRLEHNKNKYTKSLRVAPKGERTTIALETPPEQIKIFRIKISRSEYNNGCLRFFNCMHSDRIHLPGNKDLPKGMEYDENTNSIIYDCPKDTRYKYFVVQVKNSNGEIQEQFEIHVNKVHSLNSPPTFGSDNSFDESQRPLNSSKLDLTDNKSPSTKPRTRFSPALQMSQNGSSRDIEMQPPSPPPLDDTMTMGEEGHENNSVYQA